MAQEMDSGPEVPMVESRPLGPGDNSEELAHIFGLLLFSFTRRWKGKEICASLLHLVKGEMLQMASMKFPPGMLPNTVDCAQDF